MRNWIRKVHSAPSVPDRTQASVDSASYVPPAPPRQTGPDFIDVKELIKTYSLKELCQTAEAYFQEIKNPIGLIAKPLSGPDEAPHHLVRFCQILQGLELSPHQIVLDFGAGPGWASRMLTQLGCQMILTDVSPSALNIARALYEKLPPIGDVPPPTFLPFDGRRLDLPDSSVDRIFCFDAFHHVPNPAEVIAEMGRVIADGGIAGFSEPGPYHSYSDVSQSEMRSYHVVENDIRIEEIWESAQQAGFDDLRLAVYYVPPYHLSLRDYNEFMQGGAPLARYAETVRGYSEGVRLFFLYKGRGRGDSRSNPQGLRCRLTVTLDAAEDGTVTGVAEVTNTGTAAWRGASGKSMTGVVQLGCRLQSADDETRNLDFHHLALHSAEDATAVGPGKTVSISFTLPPLPPIAGNHPRFSFDLVSEQICWFADVPGGAPPVLKEYPR